MNTKVSKKKMSKEDHSAKKSKKNNHQRPIIYNNSSYSTDVSRIQDFDSDKEFDAVRSIN